MNREIKFRVWDSELREMLTPNQVRVYNNLFEIDSGKDWVEPADYDRFSLMQYTGLKDKNEKEIYDGDILSVCNGSVNSTPWIDKPYAVEYFINKGWGLPMFCWDKEGENIMDKTHWCEIIGNIYENPELLNP